ncbi:hypothetical protein [Rhodoferax sp.]|uniref:hypothetical protein n=1 Tax=Rhodoferax sp. TaxID=50421 RepID=UPI0025CE256B|nr:hypothetical protein [Rhodoferax sp.]
MSAELAVPAMKATERLEKSRALLHQAMRGNPKKQPSPGSRTPAPEWLGNLKSIPMVSVLVEAISSWWMQHPLRVASLLAADTSRAMVQPLARRNPLGLALGALALGALVAWTRPWRWVLKPAMFAGLWPQLLSKGIAHLPLESWLAALGSVAWPKPAAHSSTTDSPPLT